MARRYLSIRSLLPSAGAELQQRYPTSLRVVTNDQLDRAEQAIEAANKAAADAASNTQYSGLLGFIRNEWDTFKRHRDGATGWSERLMAPCARSTVSTIRPS